MYDKGTCPSVMQCNRRDVIKLVSISKCPHAWWRNGRGKQEGRKERISHVLLFHIAA
jgi:hypothetical protein